MRNAHLIEIENVRQGYINVVNHVIDHGVYAAPRGIGTLEIQALTIIHHNPVRSIVHDVNRGQNKRIAAAEALQLIGGFSDPDAMIRIAPNFAQFTDDGVFYGAYGPRIAPQMPTVLARLLTDPATRQARVTIWREGDLFAQGMHDYPCTMGFTFHIRGGKLSMHTHMRSNDVWWGFTYDITQFCALQIAVADALFLDVGPYFHHVDSFHIYERDLVAAEALAYDRTVVEDQRMDGFGQVHQWHNIAGLAQQMFYDVTLLRAHPLSEMLHG